MLVVKMCAAAVCRHDVKNADVASQPVRASNLNNQ